MTVSQHAQHQEPHNEVFRLNCLSSNICKWTNSTLWVKEASGLSAWPNHDGFVVESRWRLSDGCCQTAVSYIHVVCHLFCLLLTAINSLSALSWISGGLAVSSIKTDFYNLCCGFQMFNYLVIVVMMSYPNELPHLIPLVHYTAHYTSPLVSELL